MANWNGVARTNYVMVKDVEALKAYAENLPLEIEVHDEDPRFVSFSPADGDSGDFDYHVYDDFESDDEDDSGIWTWNQLCEKHLCEGQVLIVMTAGAQKLRYITGFAEAYDWRGGEVSVSLDAIYGLAVEKFGVARERIADCMYTDLPEEIL